MHTDTTPQTKQKNPLSQWHPTLTNLGFTPRQDWYEFNNVRLRSTGRWLTFTAAGPLETGRAFGRLGQFGLWKYIHEPQGLVLVFDVPQAAVLAEEQTDWADPSLNPSLDALIRFALASQTQQKPAGWQAPPRKLVESWLPSGALTVQAGAAVLQGELILNPDRWALRCPLPLDRRAGLLSTRRRWMDMVLADAQNQWRMVRLGLEGEPAFPAVLAEVDFTGAPASEYLFLAGLDALRQVVAWLAESVELVADAQVASQTFELHPHTNQNLERYMT